MNFVDKRLFLVYKNNKIDFCVKSAILIHIYINSDIVDIIKDNTITYLFSQELIIKFYIYYGRNCY